MYLIGALSTNKISRTIIFANISQTQKVTSNQFGYIDSIDLRGTYANKKMYIYNIWDFGVNCPFMMGKVKIRQVMFMVGN